MAKARKNRQGKQRRRKRMIQYVAKIMVMQMIIDASLMPWMTVQQLQWAWKQCRPVA